MCRNCEGCSPPPLLPPPPPSSPSSPSSSLLPLLLPLLPSSPPPLIFSDLLGLRSENVHLADVTDMTSSGDVVWVGTRGGHLLAFQSSTQSLLTVQHHHGNISTLVIQDADHIVTFGTNRFQDDSHSFNVWRVFSKYMHSLK